MAHPLLTRVTMAIQPGSWQKLNPATIETVPDTPGVFEVANLVRSVLYIGRGEGNLRHRLEAFGTLPAELPPSIGGYYVRWTEAPDEAAAASEREADYRTRHRDALPIGNVCGKTTAIRLVTRRAA